MEAECRSSGKYQVRHLPGVHPRYSPTASGQGSKGSSRHPLSAALTLQQCLFGDIEERYHQPIDRSGLTPASRLQLKRTQNKSPGHHFPPYGKHVHWETNGVSKTHYEYRN
ncbi:hypothetical protein TNCV_4111611 [Trichonephila clavipes]|nr:hypothetical protein TNCV_4111611 [Trichonephila clavipes]